MKAAIFGAGQQGARALRQIGPENVCCFIDNAKKGTIFGIPILAVAEFAKKFPSDTVVFLPSRQYREEMRAQLKAYHFENCFYFTPDAIQEDYSQRLSADEWGVIYSGSMLEELLERISNQWYSVQTREMLRLTKPGDSVLEIGCGGGETSLVLAMNGRKVTALDFSKQVLDLVEQASKRIGCELVTCRHDASKPLPFAGRTFDYSFQAGLLEHFSQEERVDLLMNWRASCKNMVSMIPNAHSVAYRLGKYLAEKNHTWIYGLELPQGSLYEDFLMAGYSDIKEYTIGIEHSLNFLPEGHYLRAAIEKMLQENTDMDDWGQGYLLTTTGINIEAASMAE